MSIAALQSARNAGLGRRLTTTTLVKVTTDDGDVGIVRTPPATLAATAGLSLDVYTLARVLASEGYGGEPIGRAAAAVAIAQATRNGARKSGVSLTEKLTRSTYPETAGLYGNQKGKYASTAQDPFMWHAQVARAVLESQVRDLVGGAYNYVDPAVWGKSGRDADFLAVMRSWHRTLAWIGPIPTVDSYHLIVLAPESNAGKRAASLDAVLALYERGKAGQSGPAPGDPDAGVPILPLLAIAAGVALVLL